MLWLFVFALAATVLTKTAAVLNNHFMRMVLAPILEK
jgi:hypothetical protein